MDSLGPLLWAVTVSGEATDGSLTGLIVFVALAIGVSFLCSICEAVLLSSSASQVELDANAGKRYARLARRQKQAIDRPITAILTLNTVAHTVGAAGAGAQAAAIFGNQFVGVISAVLTLLILVLSEIIPKTLGATYWKILLPVATYLIQAMTVFCYPAVVAFQALNRVMTPKKRGPTVTRAELQVMAQISSGEGSLDDREHRVLTNLLNLRGVAVKDVLTPRTVLFSLPMTRTVGEVLEEHPNIPFSRIPIYEESVDDAQGFVLRSDILKAGADDRHEVSLVEFKRPLRRIAPTVPIAQALEELIHLREHMVLVGDEFGGLAGIVTLEDMIETLLGIEITDESDTVADMQALARLRRRRAVATRGNTQAEGNGS